VGRFPCIDPLAEKYYSWSGYNYVMDSPLLLVDPDGRVTQSPIYNMDGEFLGTDDEGLQGEAIVMDERHFIQGMSHNEAKAYDLSPNLGFMNENAKNKMKSHYEALPNRPDYDGFVTIKEGIQWAKDHPNTLPSNITPDNSLYLDASKLDFGDLSVDNIGLKEGEKGNVNLFDYVQWSSSSSRATTYALGNTKIQLLSADAGTIKLFWDDYDWDYHNDPPRGTRDRLIQVERWRSGLNDSHGFRVFIYGVGIIEK